MYCTKCGKQINDGSTFCKFCGNKIKPQDMVTTGWNGEQRPQNSQNSQINNEHKFQNKQTGNGMHPKQKSVSIRLNKKFFIILVVVIVIAAAGTAGYMFYTNIQRNINLEKYVRVSIGGYEENGTANAYIDDESLIEKIAEIKKVNLADKKNHYDKYKEQCDDMQVDEIIDLIELKTDKTEKLKNGDIVTVKIKYNESKGKKYGVNLQGEKITKEVSKLSKYKDYNPFDNIKVSFEGTAPFASVTWKYIGKDSRFSSSNYSLEKSGYVDEGDIVTISFDLNGVSLEEDGYQVSKWKKKYKCKNVDKYVYRESDIPEEGMNKMKKDASDVIESYFADEYEHIGYSDLKYVGSYTLTAKENKSYYDYNNMVYMVFSAQVSSKEVVDNDDVYPEDVFSMQNVYFPIRMSDVIKKKDDSVSYGCSDYIEGTTELHYDGGWSNVKGYTDGVAMYNDLVGTQKKNYYYEVSDSLVQFGSSNAKPGSEKKQENETTAAAVTGTDADYVLPQSNSAYISEKDLTGLTKDQLRIATNEIYARYGYIFKDESLQNYFKGKSWYKPTINGDDFDDSIFNEYEKANKDELVKYQEKMGYR